MCFLCEVGYEEETGIRDYWIKGEDVPQSLECKVAKKLFRTKKGRQVHVVPVSLCYS